MIKKSDIMVAINKKIADKFPHTVYIQECPKDFIRPSFWIEHVTTSCKDVNFKTVAKTAYFTITCFTPLDKYCRPDIDELINLQEAVIRLFSDGYIQVSDRAIKVKSSAGGIDIDRAYVDLQIEYYDDRYEDEPNNTLLMQTIEIKL